jgi:hypothetical protein
MEKNIGMYDQSIRIAAVLFCIVFYFTQPASGIPATATGLIGFYFFFTALAGFCPLWKKLGISTLKAKL